MVARKVERTPKFDQDLNQLNKKHKGAQQSIDDFLNERVNGIPVAQKSKIPGLDGKPVYKVRIPLPGVGKRGGARIIYYCDTSCICALRLYGKSMIKDIPLNEIKEALESAGL